MSRLSVIKSLESQEIAVFTAQQVATLLKMTMNSTFVLLSRLEKEGLLRRVFRGHYCLPSTDVRAVASGIYPPSFVSLWSAFEYYGSTTQSPRVIDVINHTHSGRIPISLDSGRFLIRFVKTKGSLIYGFNRIYFGDKIGFMAEKERAIIDGLLFSEYVPLDEVAAAIRSGIDANKAVKYAKMTEKQAIMKRLGYLLSAEGMPLSLDEFGGLSDTYVPLDPNLPKRGKYSEKWRIIVNTVIE